MVTERGTEARTAFITSWGVMSRPCPSAGDAAAAAKAAALKKDAKG